MQDFGGGGMVMRPDVLEKCIEQNVKRNQLEQEDTAFLYMSPRGIMFKQSIGENISTNISNLYILCGRFEGIDQRIIDYYNIIEVSIGDYVLFGGEIPCIAILESCIRLLPNVIQSHTLKEESFSKQLNNMVEYDHFTKPRIWNGKEVPNVLLSGNHTKITEWRLKNAKQKTTTKNNSKKSI